MAAAQAHVDDTTPMGASLIADGATFRVWAPRARAVYVALGGASGYVPRPQDALVNAAATGEWTGFFPGVVDGTRYRFFVVGEGGSGFKRDPRARELELYGYPDCDCIVRATDSYPWHDSGFVPPAFNDLVVYQVHIGVFSARDAAGADLRPHRVAKLLDTLDRVPYLADLGVNALQPLPLVEFQGPWSLGYNGTDLYSPEMDYCVAPADLPPYLSRVNALLAAKGGAPLRVEELTGQINQLKAFVDVCHLHGLAVIPDVVYNHAGGNFDAQSLLYFDLPAQPSESDDLYFGEADLAGGRVFAFDRAEVRSFLVDNAKLFLAEYHADGLRFDEVTVIAANDGGWSFCQSMTPVLRAARPDAVLIAEYWGTDRWRGVVPPPDGMGFDLGYADGLRDGVRGVVAQASGGADAPVRLDAVLAGLRRPWNVPSAWQVYNCLENHDLVLDADGDHRHPRVAALADPSNARSWYARSRARVATGLLLTAPGVPMLFMGQEFLEDKLWSDDPNRTDRLIWWDGVDGLDRHMVDFRLCTRDLIRLRRRHPALRGEPISVYPLDPVARVVAFHRWIPGVGRDVVVVASLSETPFAGYALGFPLPGHWYEVFDSDFYDTMPNDSVQGNGGSISADGPPLHDLPASALLTLPANGLLVFARDPGDG